MNENNYRILNPGDIICDGDQWKPTDGDYTSWECAVKYFGTSHVIVPEDAGDFRRPVGNTPENSVWEFLDASLSVTVNKESGSVFFDSPIEHLSPHNIMSLIRVWENLPEVKKHFNEYLEQNGVRTRLN